MKRVNTRVEFQWDEESQEYIEIISEGYDYEGDWALATHSPGHFDMGSSNRQPPDDVVDPNQWMYDQGFGEWAEKDDLFGKYGGSEYFTKISDSLKQATDRSTYQDFFEVQTGALGTNYLDQIGKTGKGLGFAGGGEQDSMMTRMQDEYARGAMEVESGIQDRMMQAQDAITGIQQSNAQVALQLQTMYESDTSKERSGFLGIGDKDKEGETVGIW